MPISCPVCQSLPRNTTAPDLGSLTPVEDGGIFLVWACRFRTRSSPIPGVGFNGLVPHPESAVLGGLPFASSDLRDFRAHEPHVRIDDLSAPSGRFVARVTAAVTTHDCRPGSGDFFAPTDTAFASVFAVLSEGGTGSAEAPAAATCVAQHAPSTSSSSQGADSDAITDPAASVPSAHGDPTPPTVLPPSGRISPRTRRGTAAAGGAEPPAVDYGVGPDGAPRPSFRRANTPPQSLTATTASGRRYGPHSCRFACTNGTHPVRPRPRRACGNSYSIRNNGRPGCTLRCCRVTIRGFRRALFAH